jgi:hypothetical protein
MRHHLLSLRLAPLLLASCVAPSVRYEQGRGEVLGPAGEHLAHLRVAADPVAIDRLEPEEREVRLRLYFENRSAGSLRVRQEAVRLIDGRGRELELVSFAPGEKVTVPPRRTTRFDLAFAFPEGVPVDRGAACSLLLQIEVEGAGGTGSGRVEVVEQTVHDRDRNGAVLRGGW